MLKTSQIPDSLKRMADSNNWAHAIIGLGAGGYWFFKGMRLWLQKRDILNRPLSKVKSVAMGDAELSGEVEAIKLLKAPYSNADCVYCAYRLEVPHKNGWRVIDRGIKSMIFHLNDGTGRILVNPEGATFYGVNTYQQVVTEGFGRKRYTEQIVKPGQILFMEGYVSTVKQVVNGRLEESCMIARGVDQPMILSTYSEEGLLGRLGVLVPLQVFGGAMLLLGCLWYMVAGLHLDHFIR